jgi:hypothetical protein
MRTKFVTSIYSDLNGTVFGGRPSRRDHYRFSLLSLLKMNNCDFVCYTSDREIDDLKNFFYDIHNIDESRLKFIVYDLTETKKTYLIKQYKDYESSKFSDRCIEIQYCKFEWLRDNIDGEYDYYFWIDAGLSHCGLIPNRYLNTELGQRGYYESELFNDIFLENLLKFTGEKIFIIGKENRRNYWSGTVHPSHFKVHSTAYHIIGGAFGGKMDIVTKFTELFDTNVDVITEHDNRLYHEEDIMTLIWRNNEELFNVQYFDTWWHENERISGLDIDEHLKINKSFYKILEELNSYE